MTWGERFALEAHRHATQLLPRLPWLQAVEQVRRRASPSTSSGSQRFERVEVARMVGPRPPPQVRADEDLATTDGLPLGEDLRTRLRASAGIDAAPVRVHTDRQADLLARNHRAAAVTVGDHIYFAKGQFQPHEQHGFALLAHEATHVDAGRQPDSSRRRSTAAGVQEEERAALRVERAVRNRSPVVPPTRAAATVSVGHAPLAPVPTAHAALTAPAPTSVSLQPRMRPMTAALDRSFGDVPGSNPGVDVDGIKRALYADIMRQLRTDFERGG